MSYKFPYIKELEKQAADLYGKKAVLWGAGKIARLTLAHIKKEKVLNVIAICDSNKALAGTDIEGIKVVLPQEIVDKDLYIIICSRYYGEIKEQSQLMGFKNIYTCSVLFNGLHLSDNEVRNNIFSVSEIKKQLLTADLSNSFILSSMDVVITEKCSLKCRDCANLMQYYQSPQDEDFDEVFHAMDKLMSAVDYIGQLRVLGGEPFMNKNLSAYLDRLTQYKNYGDILLYSNATIIPTEEHLECFKRNNVMLSLSDYGALSRNLDTIISICNKKGIIYDVKQIGDWQDCGTIRNYHRSEEQLMQTFGECCCNKVLSIRKGKIFGCPFYGNAWTLRAAPLCNGDYVDLINESSMSEIRKKLNHLLKLKYYNACRYCGGRPLEGNSIPSARQTEKPLSYEKMEF